MNRYLSRIAPFYLTRLRTLASVTDSPVWVNKIKTRFAQLDTNKDGLVKDSDVKDLAKSLADYAKKGPNAGDEYYKIMIPLWKYGIGSKPGGVTADEFVEGMKGLYQQQDAQERVNAYSNLIFEVMDINKDGVISFSEYKNFLKTAANMNDDMIKLLFDELDVNKDGVIDRSEYQNSMIQFFFTV